MCADPNSELRALIVEDEALIAEEFKQRLSRLGFEVIGPVDSAKRESPSQHGKRPTLF